MRNTWLLLALISIFSYAQNPVEFSEYEALYRISYVRDTTNSQNRVMDDVSLLIGNKVSLFRSRNKILQDSLLEVELKEITSSPPQGEIILGKKNPYPRIGFSSEVYTQNNQMLVYKTLMANKFAFPLEKNIAWTISTETKEIAGYLCKKATGKYHYRNYIAWFTEEIPIPEGPYVFKGLPGLVVEVSEEHQYDQFSLIRFQKKITPIYPMGGVKKVTYEQYDHARTTIFDNPNAAFESATGKAVPEQLRQTLTAKYKRSNNRID